MTDATPEPRVSEMLARLDRDNSTLLAFGRDFSDTLLGAAALIASQAEALAAKEAENERLHDKLHEATIDSGPMLGESIGTALGNAIAGYRDRDMKRAASGLVAAVHILRRLEDDRDKYRWQVRDTCVRAEAAEAALKAAREALGKCKGYMLNAVIDLDTGTPKATTKNTLNGGIRMIDAALTPSTTKDS